jgi:hypothetical protein
MFQVLGRDLLALVREMCDHGQKQTVSDIHSNFLMINTYDHVMIETNSPTRNYSRESDG